MLVPVQRLAVKRALPLKHEGGRGIRLPSLILSLPQAAVHRSLGNLGNDPACCPPVEREQGLLSLVRGMQAGFEVRSVRGGGEQLHL